MKELRARHEGSGTLGTAVPAIISDDGALPFFFGNANDRKMRDWIGKKRERERKENKIARCDSARASHARLECRAKDRHSGK